MRLVIALAVLIFAAGPADAGLSVCNKSAHMVKVAVGHFNGTRWASEGWWQVATKKCVEVVTGRLDARYYYLYATDGASGTWDGGTNFCVGATDKFAVVGRGACAAHGFDRRGFFEIDTGNQLNWTQALSD
ncbi:MAG: DUF1036 domain-containing protein [Rhizomicrobium sp.]